VLAGRVMVNALALALVVLALPGVHETTGHPVLGYLVLGALFGLLINAFFKPAIEFVALPFLLGSVGLVVIVVDVAMFWMLDSLTPLLCTDGALWLIGAGVLLGLLSYLFGQRVRPRSADRARPPRREGAPVSAPTYRERIGERLRLLQIYEIFLRYGSNALFDRGLTGDLRRTLQGRF